MFAKCPPYSHPWAEVRIGEENEKNRTRALPLSAHPDGITDILVLRKDISWLRYTMRPVLPLLMKPARYL